MRARFTEAAAASSPTQFARRCTPRSAQDSALSEALAGFPWASVRVSTELPPDFADYPDIPDRIRGAVGRQLASQPPDSDAGLLHAIMIGGGGAGETPRPFTIQCDRRGLHLDVTLNLAGQAANLIVDACFALRHALLGGIRMGPDFRRRCRLEPSRPEFRRRIGFSGGGRPHGDRLHLRFLTPLAIRRGSTGVLGSLDTLPMNVANRFLRLTRSWHEPFCGEVTVPERLSAQLELISQQTFPMAYLHYSSARRAPSRLVAIQGEAVYAGNHTCFLDLLRFAEIFHAGAGTSLGLGRLLITPS